MTEYFADDRSWAKFRILELAERSVPQKDPVAVLEAAKLFEQFVMPEAKQFNLVGGKDAVKKWEK